MYQTFLGHDHITMANLIPLLSGMWSTNLGIWQDNPPEEGERYGQDAICSIQDTTIKRKTEKLNASLNDSYKADEVQTLNRQMDDLKLADETGNYTATWSIIKYLSGRNTRRNLKVKKRDG